MATSASNRGIRHVALTGRPGWYLYQTCMSHSTAVNTVNKKQTTLYLYMFVRFAGFGGFFCRNVSLFFILFIRAGT